MTAKVNIDENQRNADWLKTRTWDLPKDKDTFLAVIGGESALEHFMTLPAAEAMPQDLKASLGVTDGPRHAGQPGGVEPAATPIIEPPTRPVKFTAVPKARS
jgi:hypothetical protein